MYASAQPPWRSLEGAKCRVESLVEDFEIVGAAIGQSGLGIGPDGFVGIELGSVGRKELEMEAGIAAAQLANRLPFVDRGIVEDGDHVASEVTQHVSEERAHLGLANVVAMATEVETHPAVHRADRQARDDREAVVPVVEGDPRSLSARGPGPPKGRDQEKPRFVDEDEVRLPACGVFFTAGQRTRFQRAMRSSSRSSARRSGFCGLKPS